MSSKTVRRKVRHAPGSAGAGRKRVVMRKAQRLERQSDAIIIPGITGPFIPEAEAAAMGSTVFVKAAQSAYRLKSYFGTGGKPLTKRQQAAYEKKQRLLKRNKGEWEYKSREQTGLEERFGDVPTNIFYSPRLKKVVSYTGDEAPKRKIVGGKEVYPGAQRDWVGTQFVAVSGNPEAGLGVSKTKGTKIIKGEKMQLALWHWGDQLVRKPKDKLGYYDLAERTGSQGRFQQSYITARYKPKKGDDVSKEMLPTMPGAGGIQTGYVGWFDQGARAATIRASKATKEGVVKTQTRRVSQPRTGTAKPAFKLRKHPVRIDDILKRSPTGKTKPVTSIGKFAKKQTQTGRYSLSTKKPFTRSARKTALEGKGAPYAKIYARPKELLDETQLDKVYAKAVRGKHDFTKTLNLGVWRKLSIKQKSEVLKAAGVSHEKPGLSKTRMMQAGSV